MVRARFSPVAFVLSFAYRIFLADLLLSDIILNDSLYHLRMIFIRLGIVPFIARVRKGAGERSSG